MNSSIRVSGLDLLVHLGWSAAEREDKQTVSVDLECYFPVPPEACESDHLKDTFCYAELISKMIDYTADKQFHLIEHLGKEIFSLVKAELNAAIKIIVHITKHTAIAGFSGQVTFSYGE